MMHTSGSGWTRRSTDTCTSTVASPTLSEVTVGTTIIYYADLLEPEKPKYVPTKLDKQIQKRSFRAIQKQHERRIK